jgi:hypothetical protein
VSLSKFGTNLGQAKTTRPVVPDRTSGSDREPLLSGETDDDSSDKARLSELSLELDSLLSDLSAVNDSLSNLAVSQTGSSSSVLHTLQRHQDILKVENYIKQDHVLKFRKLQCLIIASVKKNPYCIFLPTAIMSYCLKQPFQLRIHQKSISSLKKERKIIFSAF